LDARHVPEARTATATTAARSAKATARSAKVWLWQSRAQASAKFFAVFVCLRQHLRRNHHPRSKPASTTAGSATTAAEARSAWSGKSFIRILRQDVEAAFGVLVNAVIARTN